MIFLVYEPAQSVAEEKEAIEAGEALQLGKQVIINTVRNGWPLLPSPTKRETQRLWQVKTF